MKPYRTTWLLAFVVACLASTAAVNMGLAQGAGSPTAPPSPTPMGSVGVPQLNTVPLRDKMEAKVGGIAGTGDYFTIVLYYYDIKETEKFNEHEDTCDMTCKEPPEAPCKGSCGAEHKKKTKPESFSATTSATVTAQLEASLAATLGASVGATLEKKDLVSVSAQLSAQLTASVSGALTAAQSASQTNEMSTIMTFGFKSHFAVKSQMRRVLEGYDRIKSGTKIQLKITYVSYTDNLKDEGEMAIYGTFEGASWVVYCATLMAVGPWEPPGGLGIDENSTPSKSRQVLLDAPYYLYDSCTWQQWKEFEDEYCRHVVRTGGGGGGGDGDPAYPPPFPDPGNPAIARQKDPAVPADLSRDPKPGDRYTTLRVSPGDTLVLHDPTTNQVAAKVNITEKEKGKFLPFILAGVPVAAGLLLAGSDGSGDPRSQPVVFEGKEQLNQRNGFSVWENERTPPLAVEAIVPEGGAIALESVTPNGQVVRNLPVSNFASLYRPSNEMVAQVVQFEMEDDEITAGRTDIVVLDKNGAVVSRARLGNPANTEISVQVVPVEGPPGSPASLQIHAGGLLGYMDRNVFAWDSGQLGFVIDYAASGGVSGPTRMPAAPFLSIPIDRGAKGGEIHVKTEQEPGE